MTSPGSNPGKQALGPRCSGVSGKGGKAQVKPFTKESLERLENKTVQLVREYGFTPRRKLSVEDGSVLPGKFEPFPSTLYGRPLEEIDNFIYDETFCVVSKRFKKNYIHRFTATSAFFVFSPWNAFRRTCIFLSTNQYFDYVVMVTILINCVFLAMSETVEEAEYIFLAIYTAEMIIKSIAKGFILNKYTYLRNPWNWLDFVVITSGYATIGMDVGSLSGLRTFRVLRALKTISILPGLKTIINALLHSFKQLAEVMTLTIFCLMVFALFALQVYMGELRNKCVKVPDLEENATDVQWFSWINNTENWKYDANDKPVMCGNVTGARHCPNGFFCVQAGDNPNHGYTSFDNFLWSMLTTFQLITLDYWEDVYNKVLSSCGPISVVFFTVVVFFGSFYLINLMLAVVALSYEEEAEITNEERKKDLTDHRDDSTFSFDPSNINVKQLDRNNRKRVDSRKGVLLASYTRKKTRRRKKTKSPAADGTTAVEEEGSGSVNGDRESGGGSQRSRSRSATPSPRLSATSPPPEAQRPRSLTLNPVVVAVNPDGPVDHVADTLHPANALVLSRRGQLLTSRHPSSNTSEGNNRESSLDDSGVVDDHEEGDVTSEEVTQLPHAVPRVNTDPVTVTLRSKEIRVIKCNGVSPSHGTKQHMYTLPSDYLSHIVVLDDLPDRNCENCSRCCIDYEGWLRFQAGLYNIVKDPLFDLLITLCIVLNTIFLAMEHHGMSENVRQALDIGNKVFTSIFSLECFLKLLALSKDYFDCGWNIFDLIIVTASILDLAFELVDGGLSVLRGLRLLRVLKLAQSWTTMKVLLSIIISTIGALGNLTFVLVIVIYIFAVIGMQLFSKDYTPEVFAPDPVPRWNFNDFFHSFMMIFRILCGEWIEPLWDCMRAEKLKGPETCFAIFLPALVMGNFMVLNLFLALLLNSFNSEELKSKKENKPVVECDDEETREYKDKLRHHYKVVVKLWRRCWRVPDPPTPPPEILFHRCPPPPEHLPVNRKSSDVVLMLSSYQEEVGDDSKLARSFERLRSIVRRKRILGGREKNENEKNMKLEEMVREVMSRHKSGIYNPGVRETIISLPETRRQEGMTIKQPPDKRVPQGPDVGPQSLSKHSTPIKQPEMRQYSASVQENLHKRAEDKRYSLIMQRSAAIDEQDGIQDTVPEPAVPEATVPESTEPETEKLIPETKQIIVVPEKRSDRRFSIATTQQASSKDSNAESIELDLLGRGPGETDTMLPTAEKPAKRPWHALVSYVDELTVGGRKDSKGHYVDGMGTFPGFGNNKPVKIPQDCFHPRCYEHCLCCKRMMTTAWGAKWTRVRTAVLSVVDTPMFEWFILVLIFASSITLCFEDIYLDENLFLKRILYWTNMGFCALFSIEMVLKWIALGFWRYFTSFWTILDFIIVFVSVFSLLIEENENLKVLRSLRTLRALRPLRAISRWQGMRIVVNALMYAIPSIFNVLLVCLVFWLIFSIMGVQFFGGKFFKCKNDKGDVIEIEFVNTFNDCEANNYTWENSKITFDNVGHAYLALFQVATFEGWMEVMEDAVDARGVDLQPQREANLYAYIYFVIFIVCGSFFTLNLFIGVIIDNFNMLKKKYEGGVLEMFLTPSQKHYYTAMKKLGRKKPQKVIKRPLNQFLAMFYDLSNSRRFEIAIFVLIFLNMLSMGVEHYGQPHSIYFVLEVSNAFFTTVFGLEATVKIIGLRHHYFTVPWNLFDFILVLASILGILMEDIMIDLPVSPTLLRVVRVFRIGRILRLIKAAKGIRKLLFALVVSLPALFNIGALLALITFIYAIIGMSLFGHVRQQGALDDMVNFETFGRSMQLLFRLMTSAGWNDVLESLMIQPPECDPTYKNQPNGNCGHPLLAITYFTSFIIISYMIVINMYIAIILENFNQAHQEEEIGIVEDDLEMFYIRWSKYDPHATQFIRFTQLSDFIASLDPPLGIPKPNVVALVSFNLPIARGNKIHCLDILHSLVKYVLGHVEESEDFKKLQDQMDVKFKKQFPTRKELEIVSSTRIWKREDKAARLIQSTFREYLRHKRAEPMDLEDEMTQTSSPGGGVGWQSRLSAFLHVHRGSRASSRKSSRASDASELSDLGGAWLNLPLLFLSSTHPGGQTEELLDPGNGHVSIMVSEPSPEAGPSMIQTDNNHHRTSLSTADLPLRDSIAIGLRELRRKNAAGDINILVTEPSPDSNKTSPNRSLSDIASSPSKDIVHPYSSETNIYAGMKDMHPSALTPSGGALSLLPADGLVSQTTPNTERHPTGLTGTRLSLLPTGKPRQDPPPPPPRRMRFRRSSDATLVHVLVHRESEEDAAS